MEGNILQHMSLCQVVIERLTIANRLVIKGEYLVERVVEMHSEDNQIQLI